MASDCGVCGQLRAHPDRMIHEDGAWASYPLGDVPGWLTLATQVHVKGFAELSDTQASSLGRVLRDLCSALQVACGASRVQVIHLGIGSVHAHFGLLALSKGERSPFKREDLLDAIASRADPGAAAASLAALRQALEPKHGPSAGAR
jgi:hypothetical protein